MILAFFLLILAAPAYCSLRDIIPRPQQMGVISESPTVISGSFYLVVPDDPTEAEILVEQEVIRLFQENSLRTPILVGFSHFTYDIPSIWIGTSERFPALVEALDSTGIAGMGLPTHNEEYQIFVDEFRILILGEDDRALRWGALSLMRLIGNVNGSLNIDRVYVRDWPDYPERIATINSPMRNTEQDDYCTAIADSSYIYKMNEIEWNNGDQGMAPEEFSPWTRAFYFPHAEALRERLRSHGQKLTVSCDNTGKTVDDFSWQEAIPITNTQMRVTSSAFEVIPDCHNIQIENGDFESWSGNQPSSWTVYRDNLWSHFSRDMSIRHSGSSSLKIQTPGNTLTLRQWFSVQPYGYYNLRFWCKTSGYSGSFYVDAQGPPPITNGVIRLGSHLSASSTQDWTEYVVPFSSYHLDTLRLLIGLSSLSAGTIWFDDIRIEAADLTRLVRRSDTPLSVYEEPGHVLRTEGVDYRVIETYSSSYENYVRQPRLERIPGGALYLNDIVSVDWGCAVYFQNGKNTVCFSLLEPLQAYQNRVRNADSLLSPDGFKIHINEVAYAGHDQLCQSRGLTPAQLVGQYCNNMYEIIQSRRPGIPVRIYSDPFDYYTYDPRAMPTTSNPWTRGENGEGTLAQISSDIEIMTMHRYSQDLDSTFITYEQYGFPSVIALYTDGYESEQLAPVLTAKKYPDCRGLIAYGWSSFQSKMHLFGSLAWNTGPFLIHTPVQPILATDSVSVSAEIWGDELGSDLPTLTSVLLRYRWLPSGNWIEMSMSSSATDHYAATIPPSDSTPEGMEYAIIAQDSRGEIRRAPSGENEAFLVQLSASSSDRVDRALIQIEHTVMSIGDYTLIEWEPVTSAEYYEVHVGSRSDFSENSSTLLARQNRDTPRYLLQNTTANKSSEISVYARIKKRIEASKTCTRIK
ncbi:hypothetical protein KKC97_08520 [bacterium]|nr:hypothetical protein [bacterium]